MLPQQISQMTNYLVKLHVVHTIKLTNFTLKIYKTFVVITNSITLISHTLLDLCICWNRIIIGHLELITINFFVKLADLFLQWHAYTKKVWMSWRAQNQKWFPNLNVGNCLKSLKNGLIAIKLLKINMNFLQLMLINIISR